jgi:hypothetical protein
MPREVDPLSRVGGAERRRVATRLGRPDDRSPVSRSHQLPFNVSVTMPSRTMSFSLKSNHAARPHRAFSSTAFLRSA